MKKCVACTNIVSNDALEFCSRECLLAARQQTGVCRICKRQFSYVLGCKRTLCNSSTCKKSAYPVLESTIRIACANCGKVDVRKSSELIKAGHTFCNSICSWEFYTKMSGKNFCLTCKNDFVVDDFGDRRFCSKICSEKTGVAQLDATWVLTHTSSKGTGKYTDDWELQRMLELDLDKSVVSWKKKDNALSYYQPDFIITYDLSENCVVHEDVRGYYDAVSEQQINAYKNSLQADVQFRVLNRGISPTKIDNFKEPYENDYGVTFRPTMESIWMSLANCMAQRSTCLRAKIGAVVTDVNMSKAFCLGYNGDEAGGKNQCDSLEPGKCNCTHAEINALSKNDSDISNAILFVSQSPCYNCARVLVSRRIKRVIYDRAYRDDAGVKLLRARGIEVFKYLDLVLHS